MIILSNGVNLEIVRSAAQAIDWIVNYDPPVAMNPPGYPDPTDGTANTPGTSLMVAGTSPAKRVARVSVVNRGSAPNTIYTQMNQGGTLRRCSPTFTLAPGEMSVYSNGVWSIPPTSASTGGSGGGIASVNNQTGPAVTLAAADVGAMTPTEVDAAIAAITAADVGLGSVDNTADASKPVSTPQQTVLDLKANLAGPTFTDVPAAPTASPGTNTTQLSTTAFVAAAIANLIASSPAALDTLNELAAALGNDANFAATITASLAGKVPTGRTVASKPLTADVTLVKADVGLGSVDNVADGSKPVSTAQAAAIAAVNDLGTYQTLLNVGGSHIAARVAGTYAIPRGDALAVGGTGTLYPLGVVQIAAADLPAVGGLATKLRIRAQLFTNDVAPTGNFTFGLYPITRPATSGGAGLCIFTLGTVVPGSNGAVFTAPAADLLGSAVGADFALPADGLYVIGVVTTATVAASAHVHVAAQLQARNA